MAMTADNGKTAHSHAMAQQLAQQLVRHMGVQGATRTCIENHWQGVLAIVQTMGPASKVTPTGGVSGEA